MLTLNYIFTKLIIYIKTLQYKIKMSFEVSKLSQLLGGDYDELISYISSIGVIAGSSVLYCFDDYIDKSKIGDIDVFCTSVDNFIKICELIYQQNIKKIILPIDDQYTGDIFISTLHFDIGADKNFNIILSKHESPTEIINNFDMDYIQCAWYNNKIYTSKIFDESLSSKIVRWYDINTSAYRLKKALQKGYKLKYLCSNYQEILENHEEIMNCKNMKFIKSVEKNYHICDDNSLILEPNANEFCTIKMENYEINIVPFKNDKSLIDVYNLSIEDIYPLYKDYYYYDIFDVKTVCNTTNILNLSLRDTQKRTAFYFCYVTDSKPKIGLNLFLCNKNTLHEETYNEHLLPFTNHINFEDNDLTFHCYENNAQLSDFNLAENIFLYDPSKDLIFKVLELAKCRTIKHLYINILEFDELDFDDFVNIEKFSIITKNYNLFKKLFINNNFSSVVYHYFPDGTNPTNPTNPDFLSEIIDYKSLYYLDVPNNCNFSDDIKNFALQTQKPITQKMKSARKC